MPGRRRIAVRDQVAEHILLGNDQRPVVGRVNAPELGRLPASGGNTPGRRAGLPADGAEKLCSDRLPVLRLRHADDEARRWRIKSAAARGWPGPGSPSQKTTTWSMSSRYANSLCKRPSSRTSFRSARISRRWSRIAGRTATTIFVIGRQKDRLTPSVLGAAASPEPCRSGVACAWARAAAADRPAQAGDQEAEGGEHADGEQSRRERKDMTDSLGVSQHLDPPNKGATGRKKGTGRPGERRASRRRAIWASVARYDDLPPESAGPPGVGGQLLLQPEPGRQPVRQGMIEVQGQASWAGRPAKKSPRRT